jgi:hypothetical protein
VNWASDWLQPRCTATLANALSSLGVHLCFPTHSNHLVVHALCCAQSITLPDDHSPTCPWLSSLHQVLRKINPLEASILRDPTLHARLRFRFGGDSFPPIILYKIFINASVQVRAFPPSSYPPTCPFRHRPSAPLARFDPPPSHPSQTLISTSPPKLNTPHPPGSQTLPSEQYVSGATQILPGSEAAYDACGEMGERKYFDIVLGDIERQTPIADQRLLDMAFGMQDRLKEHGNFDSHPVFMGGKGNSWRVLVDDKYTCNENALRFDPNSEALSGKKLRILDEVLASMERTMMERAAATPLPPVKKEFASQVLHPRL